MTNRNTIGNVVHWRLY